MPDIAIPIVFPDYLIAVNTPKMKVKIPDLIPGFDLLPESVEVPETQNKFPELGHAGILFINGTSGTTKYYEYGRYASSAGNVRKLSIRDVKIMSDGHPSKASLLYTLSQISASSGQGGRILGAYIETPGKFQSMLDYAQKRMQENSNPNRKKYDLISNSCNHFMKGVLEAAGVDTPYMLDPRPNSYIAEIRLDYPKLGYSRAEHKLVVENPPASLASIIRVYAQPAAA
jgi:hypothetical protein